MPRLPYGSTGLPRQADAFLAMTTGTGIGEVVGDLQSDANGRIVKQQRTTEHERLRRMQK